MGTELCGLIFSRIETYNTYFILEVVKNDENNKLETKPNQKRNDYMQDSSESFQNLYDNLSKINDENRRENNQAPGNSKSFQKLENSPQKTKKIEVKDARRFTTLPSQTPEIKTTNRQVFTKEEWEFFGYKTDLLEQQKNN